MKYIILLTVMLVSLGCKHSKDTRKEVDKEVVIIEPTPEPEPVIEPVIEPIEPVIEPIEPVEPVVTALSCFVLDPDDPSIITNYWVEDPACTRDVVLPDSIRTIENQAFYNMYLLSIVLNEGLQTIEEYAFGANGLTEINIPDSVTFIGTSAFVDNPWERLNIGSGIETIQLSAFETDHNDDSVACIDINKEDAGFRLDEFGEVTPIFNDDSNYGSECL